ncbi:transcription elongation factor GreAB [Phytopseudomonas dryadis]|uniref:Transcription elongation factor GreAB n=1 Tax=Phytopseudomonas dryadis TaxID=2487520 RepID=A0ABY1YZL2_9GAMM|nr:MULTISPECIES: transcription elongation factor GreAB [Pseudomonas]TBU99712.1 transcription elongation factor GreAB [Pseudomonas dryadis]TBV12677.1 transcription elongation factor GreAB [Pseudomonas sp. FRB 230]
MDKQPIADLMIERLGADLLAAEQAARVAHETATHEENVAENKYDTLGLEAAYLAAGQARRVEEIGLSLRVWRQLQLRPYDPALGIRLTALVQLADESGHEQWLFLGPDGAGIKVRMQQREILLLSPHAPLGQRLLGRRPGDEIELRIAGRVQHHAIIAAY